MFYLSINIQIKKIKQDISQYRTKIGLKNVKNDYGTYLNEYTVEN